MVMLGGAVGQGEQVAGQPVALRQADVGIVVGQVGEGVGDLAEEQRQLAGDAHGDGQHLHLLIEEQVAPLGAPQVNRGAAGAQMLAQGAQPVPGTAHIEDRSEGVAQGVHLAVGVEQPQAHAAAG
ncbi:MAG TPA: hypothetical protein VLM87_00445, partial [Rubrivivax sp.]|nr:hypothetical protein [Rubrivivax sp.]